MPDSKRTLDLAFQTSIIPAALIYNLYKSMNPTGEERIIRSKPLFL